MRALSWLWGTLAFSLLVTAAVVFVPFLNTAFSFQPITVTEYLAALALALVVIPGVEAEKAIRRKVIRNRGEVPVRPA